jgi:trans-2,3-dihydro-3-hydroxyanthranilate isomerase
MEYRFRILNVFTVGDDRLSGNPLCVFEDARGLSDGAMQALARQFNLSETTFVLPPSAGGTTARVRIFTPTFEMPFAGHPTLGTAHVVRDLNACGERVVLDMKAGHVEVVSEGDRWTLRAARPPETRRPEGSRAELAAMLGRDEEALLDPPLWVDTGAEQLIIPLRSGTDVRGARPDAALLARFGFSAKRGASMAYAWAAEAEGEVVARFFFLVHGGVVEDPATGSACANLGGWMVATGRPLPVQLRVRQGDEVRRPSELLLHVDAEQHIFVTGSVIELGRGAVTLSGAG